MKNGVPLSNTAFKQTVKKSVLGKLDNVMHQTPGITPFKSNNAVKLEGSMAKLSIQKAAKQTVSRDREEINVKTNSCFLGSYKVRREAVQSINLFNYTDFPNERCVSKCNKRRLRIAILIAIELNSIFQFQQSQKPGWKISLDMTLCANEFYRTSTPWKPIGIMEFCHSWTPI